MVIAVVVAAIAIWGFFCFIPKHLANEKTDNDNLRIYIEAIKVLVLILGGIGGLCGLVIAAKRQEKFEQQVENAQSQLFNERLGRGIEQLANTDIALRVAGVRILDNLAKTATEEDTELIVEIIYTYISTKAKIRRDEDENIIPNTRDKNENRDDIVYAVNTIFKHRKKAGKSHIDIKLPDFDLRELDLSEADLTGAFLWESNLTKANLSKADLTKANLSKADLTRTNLCFANLTMANLLEADLTGTLLLKTDLTKTDLSKADLTGAFLWESNLTGADLSEAVLTGAELSKADLEDIRELTQEQFDQIIYHTKYPPENIPNHLTLPADRTYNIDQDGKRIFVKSKKDWSGEKVDKYIEKLRTKAESNKKIKTQNK